MQKILLISALFALPLGLCAQSKKALKQSLDEQTAQIQALQQQLKTLEQGLAQADNQNLALSKQLSRREAADEELQAQIKTLQAQVQAQNERLQALEKGSAGKYLPQDKTDQGGGGSQTTGKTTQIKLSETSFDFGEITQGSQVNHEFVIHNLGQEPLQIQSALGSCGCTIPEYPQKPIPPGGKGILKVHFNSNGKSGLQRNSVRFWANTEPEENRIEIIANVKSK